VPRHELGQRDKWPRRMKSESAAADILTGFQAIRVLLIFWPVSTPGAGPATSPIGLRPSRHHFRSYRHRENVVLRRVGSGLEHVTGLTLERH
jgi:hypothetical protein